LNKGPERAKPTFFKNVLHSYIWSSFVEIDKLYLNLCRTRSETVRLGSYDRPKYLDPRKNACGSKKYFGNILAHSGSILFLCFFKRIY
jgi:hypothetical protein